MAKLEYAKDGRLLFTKEMKKKFKILMPQMLPTHFALICNSFKLDGYDTEILSTTHRGIVDEGLKSVHNDTCYPALLVIGQMLDAIKSGKYDLENTALMITQTGGGCRASNYIHLLRKALKKSGLEKIPVVSLNLSGLEHNPGFKFNFTLLKRLIYSLLYGDIITLMANQCRPYEKEKGSTDKLISYWVDKLTEEYKKPKNVKYKKVLSNFDLIAKDFNDIPVERIPKIRVGVVGEIYIKYAPLGNNNLEQFLLSEGVEVVVPGILDFIIFKADNRITDVDLFGGNPIKRKVVSLFKDWVERCQRDMISVISKFPGFRAPVTFEHIRKLVDGYVGHGNKMGEGWLLTAEMLELINTGINNIVCTQPFGCLPNHISGKGMMRKIKENFPESNIVAIDYDPGSTRINQENRIKLMLANAKQYINKTIIADEKNMEQEVLSV